MPTKESILNLKDNAVFQLSLSSKELFHSNFLCWLADSQTAVFNYVLKECFGAPFCFDPTKHVALREHHNLDFCIREKGEDDKYGRVLFVLENKFKSLPYETQLHAYTDKVDKLNGNKNSLSEVHFVLLTLSSDVSWLNNKNGLICDYWKHVTYKNYADALANANSSYVTDGFTRELIQNYQKFIEQFSEYIENSVPSAESIKAKPWSLLNSNAAMKELRMDDIWQKLVISKIATVVTPQWEYSRGVNIKDILTQEYIVGDMFVGTGFTRGTALIDLKIKLDNEMVYGVQIQDGYYKRILERTADGTKEVFESYLAKPYLKGRFQYGENCCWVDTDSNIYEESQKLYPKTNHKGKTGLKGFGGYGKTFVCQSKKLNDSATIGQVLEAMIKDVSSIVAEIQRKDKK